MEEWKVIEGYDGDYEISSYGRVKSYKRNGERLLKNILSGSGYYQVCLSNNSKIKIHRVHQLVAIHFLNHIPNGHIIEVSHKDQDSLNNYVDNLQLLTVREHRSVDGGGSSKYVGVYRHACGKWVSTIRINKKLKYLGYYTDEYEAHLAYQKALKGLEKETTDVKQSINIL